MEWISVEKALPTISEEKAGEGFVQIKVLVWNGEDWLEAWYQPDAKEFYDVAGWMGFPAKGGTHWAIPETPTK